jgi:pyridinium-3,5-bisthiocarboxylic acid mononucleotide nickel chelatase
VSRIVYFDCASGASGDMMLGALVDLGLPLDVLRAELAKVPLRGYRLEARQVDRSGLRATKVDVLIDAHDHDHHDGHGHGHGHGHDHDPGHGHERGLGDILDLLARSTLDRPVKDFAAALFRRLAEAEAAVHGTSPEAVHFHEVGAIDSIVDTVGGVVGLSWLRADRFVASALNVGGGSVTMSHGTFAVPPPATARLVQGVPVYGAGEGELLTPTGALLVTAHATDYGPLPPLRIEAIGHGAGTRDTPGRPNVLRVVVGEEAAVSVVERVLVLETEIDDMPPQLYGPLMDRLLATGAKDVFYTPIQMKKGRPGMLVTVLCDPERREALEEVLFSETTTLGVRRQEWDRTALERDRVMVETAHGPIAIKVGRRGPRVYNAQPEFEDCRRAAHAGGVPVKEVWAAALSAYRQRGGDGR